MQFFKILSKREFTYDGEKKSRWFRVGELKVTDGGGRYMRLYLFPDLELYLVEENNHEKEDSPQD